MTNDEYQDTQNKLALIASIVSGLPLTEFIQQARHAETVGPILDPTLYMRGGGSLRTVIRHAEALEAFQREVSK